MKKTKITTMTELRYKIIEKESEKIWEYLISGEWKGKTVEIELENWYLPFGKFICEIKKFVPKGSNECEKNPKRMQM